MYLINLLIKLIKVYLAMAKNRVEVPQPHRVPAHLARRFHQICLGLTAEVTERAGLTQRGQALRDRLRKDALAAQDRILSPLPAADRVKFLDLLTRLVEVHETYARPGNGRRRPPRAVVQTEARRPA
jgi:hypothetical protein